MAVSLRQQTAGALRSRPVAAAALRAAARAPTFTRLPFSGPSPCENTSRWLRSLPSLPYLACGRR